MLPEQQIELHGAASLLVRWCPPSLHLLNTFCPSPLPSPRLPPPLSLNMFVHPITLTPSHPSLTLPHTLTPSLSQSEVLHKLLTNVEAPPKEKHVRSKPASVFTSLAKSGLLSSLGDKVKTRPSPSFPPPGTLIATWREKGCMSFWKVLQTFQLFRSHIVSWKACFIVHRAFRDGHPAVSAA